MTLRLLPGYAWPLIADPVGNNARPMDMERVLALLMLDPDEEHGYYGPADVAHRHWPHDRKANRRHQMALRSYAGDKGMYRLPPRDGMRKAMAGRRGEGGRPGCKWRPEVWQRYLDCFRYNEGVRVLHLVTAAVGRARAHGRCLAFYYTYKKCYGTAARHLDVWAESVAVDYTAVPADLRPADLAREPYQPVTPRPAAVPYTAPAEARPTGPAPVARRRRWWPLGLAALLVLGFWGFYRTKSVPTPPFLCDEVSFDPYDIVLPLLNVSP